MSREDLWPIGSMMPLEVSERAIEPEEWSMYSRIMAMKALPWACHGGARP